MGAKPLNMAKIIMGIGLASSLSNTCVIPKYSLSHIIIIYILAQGEDKSGL
jgi:hypothetical protein